MSALGHLCLACAGMSCLCPASQTATPCPLGPDEKAAPASALAESSGGGPVLVLIHSSLLCTHLPSWGERGAVRSLGAFPTSRGLWTWGQGPSLASAVSPLSPALIFLAQSVESLFNLSSSVIPKSVVYLPHLI